MTHTDSIKFANYNAFIENQNQMFKVLIAACSLRIKKFKMKTGRLHIDVRSVSCSSIFDDGAAMFLSPGCWLCILQAVHIFNIIMNPSNKFKSALNSVCLLLVHLII